MGITTFNTDMLKISVSALAHIKSRFLLIVHNDNPDIRLSVRDIRKIGYSGPLQIINCNANVGLRVARVRILDIATRYACDEESIIYVEDYDILLNIDVPNVSNNVYAVIQCAMMINTRVSDLITAVSHPDMIVPDGANISLARPHIGMRGTAVRMKCMRELVDLIGDDVTSELTVIDASLAFRPPIDTMMWLALNTLMRNRHPECVPIFMDSVNYIQNNIDFSAIKYGRPGTTPKNYAVHLARALDRYDSVIKSTVVK